MSENANLNLNEIVKQLEWCDYECTGGPLKNNSAWIAVKLIAQTCPDPVYDLAYLRARLAEMTEFRNWWRTQARQWEEMCLEKAKGGRDE